MLGENCSTARARRCSKESEVKTIPAAVAARSRRSRFGGESTSNQLRLRSGGEQQPGRVRNLDVDLERRDVGAAIHADLDVVALDDNVLGDRGEDVLAQQTQDVGLAARCPLVREQDLQPLPRYGGGAPAPEQVEEVHAALRPNSLSNSRLRSLGIVIGTASPPSLRAASR